MARIRLSVTDALGPGQPVSLDRDAAHYLFNVMRLGVGAEVMLFNGRDGEWRAEITETGKRGGTAVCAERTQAQWAPPDLWLLFAPVKKARTDFIVEKAVEMGVARILPVQTELTNSDRIRRDRLSAHAREAAEQCGAVVVPEVAELAPLARLLDGWEDERRLMFCDEALADGRETSPLETAARGPWAILIGPEGGFSETERARLSRLPVAHRVRLGPRILRADTAAVAALTLWQSRLGDWQ